MRTDLGLRVSLLVLCLLTACATTQLKDTWRDPQFNGAPLRNVLVIGVSRSSANRRVFEDGFSAALREAGTPAAASYQFLPGRGQLSRTGIKQVVKKINAGGVLITRVVSVEQHLNVMPGGVAAPTGTRFYRWYDTAWRTTPPTIHQFNVVTIESTLWDIRQEKPVWSGTSESLAPDDVDQLTADLAKVMIAKMKEDKVL
jgi:hypothetical protein